jgi:protein-tyrosine phosphatase
MKLLFVCLGNICRSPLAEGIMKHKLKKEGLSASVFVDSVGFEPFHQGDYPDARAIKVARNHGIDISDHKARLFEVSDFDDTDRIFVMDRSNYRDVMKMARNDKDKKKVDFLLNILNPGSDLPVPDPWYGNQQDFETTYQTLDQALTKLLESLNNVK